MPLLIGSLATNQRLKVSLGTESWELVAAWITCCFETCSLPYISLDSRLERNRFKSNLGLLAIAFSKSRIKRASPLSSKLEALLEICLWNSFPSCKKSYSNFVNIMSSFKSRPFENSLVDFCTSENLTFCYFFRVKSRPWVNSLADFCSSESLTIWFF